MKFILMHDQVECLDSFMCTSANCSYERINFLLVAFAVEKDPERFGHLIT